MSTCVNTTTTTTYDDDDEQATFCRRQNGDTGKHFPSSPVKTEERHEKLSFLDLADTKFHEAIITVQNLEYIDEKSLNEISV